MTGIVVSAIIVTYNSESTIRECITAAGRELATLPHEVFVVDNASADNTMTLVETCDETVQVIRSQTNLGFSRANNLALERAKGEYVLFLNPDAITHSGCITRLVEWLGRAPGYVAAGPQMLASDGTTSRACARRLPTIVNLTWQLLLLDRVWPRSPVFGMRYYQPWGWDTDRDVECLSGAAMLVRRSALSAVGHFDEEVPLFLDDMDLCKRLERCGRKRYLAAARVVHVQNVSGQSVSSTLIGRLSLQANYVYLRKHGWPLSERLFLGIVVMSAVVGAVLAGFAIGVGRKVEAARLKERSGMYLEWARSRKGERVVLPTVRRDSTGLLP